MGPSLKDTSLVGWFLGDARQCLHGQVQNRAQAQHQNSGENKFNH
jgi:hypothetical protein